jgi:hypothetical protein
VFNAHVAALPSEPPSSIEWERAKLISLKVECDDLNKTFTPPPLNAGNLSKTIRIASTHFDDGATIQFTVTGKFQLEDDDDGMGTVVVEKVWTPTLEAYNKGLILATRVDANGNVVDRLSNLYPISVAGVAEGIVEDARTKLGPLGTTNMRHDVVPTVELSRQSSEATVKASLEGMTVFVAGTHGNAQGFNDSSTASSSANPGFISWAEVATSVTGRGSAFPLPNLVAMYSCATMSSQYDPTAKSAFQLSGFDRGYVGFDAPVLSVLQKGNGNAGVDILDLNDYLHDHSKQLMSSLLDGLTLGEALNLANFVAPPRQMATGFQTNVLNMKLVGDPRMRLMQVYLSSAEETALIAGGGTVSWYYTS